jgi:hypothetical protein
MYKLIKGNIQQLVDHAILSMEGYVLPPTIHPVQSLHTLPQQTPALGSPSSSLYSFEQRRSGSTSPYPSQQLQALKPTKMSVTGTMEPHDRTDSRLMQPAEDKNKGGWDQAKQHEIRILQE